ncbi:MAG: flavin-containing monooxygenase [Methyloligellaceae bacterium]
MAEPVTHTENTTQNQKLPNHVDILVVGAGLSGISAAYHIQTLCPGKSYAILEARNSIGGTWDLFRYPGIRSDSDMYTLGYSFKPWTHPDAIAKGPLILDYIKETAAENNITQNIYFNQKLAKASWSSENSLWTIETSSADGQAATMTCNYIYSCTGYYDYDEAHAPRWDGMENYKGQIVHPQFWPEDLDYEGKKVVVIGSGATAITLIPSMADKTEHITMLQRSPTYVVSRPSKSKLAKWLQRLLPAKWAYHIIRMHAIRLGAYFYRLSKEKPIPVKLELLRLIRQDLGPEFDVERHFFPSYNPWDQRVCLITDGDLFEKMREGKASVVTDHINHFTENGIKLGYGKTLEADIVITATGLKLKALGGIQASVDGKPIDWAETMLYKGSMYSGIPNFISAHGYTNASWTLKCDLTAEYFCKQINFMDENGYSNCVPLREDPTVEEQPAIDLKSGYVQRAYAISPKQGNKAPWMLDQNYFKDKVTFLKAPIDDGVLKFGKSA